MAEAGNTSSSWRNIAREERHGNVAVISVNRIIRAVKLEKNVCTTRGRCINVSVLLEIKKTSRV